MVDGPRNSLAGAVTFLFSGAPIVLAGVYLSSVRQGLWLGGYRWILPGVIISSLMVSFFSGGRNIFLISTVYLASLFFLHRLSFRRVKRIRRSQAAKKGAALSGRTKLLLLLCLGFGIWLSLSLFIERAYLRADTIAGALEFFASNYYPVSEPAFGNEAFLVIHYILAQLTFYFSSGITFLDQYFSTNYCPATLGGSSLFGLYRIIDFLLGTRVAANSLDAMLIRGAYLSMPGQLYVDFCHWGIGVSVLLAAYGCAITRKVLRGQNRYLFVSAYVVTTLVLAPLYSVTSVGNGFSLLIFSLAATYLFGTKSRSLVAVDNAGRRGYASRQNGHLT
jgi:hypothetical protein